MAKKLTLAEQKSVTLFSKLVTSFSMIALVASVTFSSEQTYAQNFYTMYRYPVAATGSCIAAHDSTPKEILERNGIDYSGNPSEAEIAALAKGIAQVERLCGDPIPHPWRQDYKFIQASGKWNQGANTINVRRLKGSPKGTNVGRMMHELGHKVGNSGVYQQYARFTGRTRCRITGYAASKFNEEFAEVFEAYVVYPDLLKQKCPKAFEFMVSRLFPNTNNKIASCKNVTDEGSSDLPDQVPLPIPRPPDLGQTGEVESDEDVVIEPESDDQHNHENDEEDENEENETPAISQNQPVPMTNIPIPTPRPTQGVR
ncbi:hypothetical protein [Bdellovibrio bacteriovorus]|uniref:hypothetical protein n=1 Tax=Bdellovibrio TaxID=958 RepID=UPI0035A82C52